MLSSGKQPDTGPSGIGEFAGKNWKLPAAVIVLLFLSLYYELFLCRKVFVHDAIIWYGAFHYYVAGMADGNFPFWNPYMQSGTPFYPNMSIYGLLDPVILAGIAAVRAFSVSPLTVYIYFRLFRLAVFVVGAFFLFRHVTKNSTAAALSSGLLLFALPVSYFIDSSIVDFVFLTPFVAYCLLRFFEEPEGPRVPFYFFCIAFMTGITMNVFIPAYFLFNLIALVVVWIAINFRQAPAVIRAFKKPRIAASFAAAVLAVVMMSAPPLAVFFGDASSGGELFPMLRIVQKSGGSFKKIEATEIGSAALSAKYTGMRSIFSSYGNMANIICPDILTVIYSSEKNKQSPLKMAENSTYIGIIPFALALLAVFFYKSRFKRLALIMLAVISANLFSFYGSMDVPHNIVQETFDRLFPPLKMIEVRQDFGGFFLLYLCMLSCMGLTVLFDRERFRELVKARLGWIVSICAAIVSVKIFIAGYFWEKWIFTTYYDLFVLCQPVFFAALVYLYSRGKLKHAVVGLSLVVLIFADLFVYNRQAAATTLEDSGMLYSFIAGSAEEGPSQLFRTPLAAPYGMGFGEDLIRRKGALTYGNNHSLFSTKRYYDILTHVPLQNQLRLTGVVYPIIGFFPMDRVRTVTNRKDLLAFYATAPEDEVSGLLFVEDAGRRPALPDSKKELGPLAEYESVAWLDPSYMNGFISDYMMKNQELLNAIRENVDKYLDTPLSSLRLTGFSPNEVKLTVSNSGDGYLYYNDGWSRYWRAYDGPREIPVVIANYNSKAVFLGRGEHAVRFVFDPTHYKLGLASYYAGLLLSASMAALSLLRLRQSGSNPNRAKEGEPTLADR